MTPEPTVLHLAPDVWIALVTFVAGPLAASVAANLSLRGAVTALTQKMNDFESRLAHVERKRTRHKRAVK